MMRKTSEAAVEALALKVAHGHSVRKAAGLIGMPERTASGVAATDTFKHAVKRIRESIIAQTVGILSVLSTRAATRLGELAVSKDDNVSLKACSLLLDKLIAVESHAALAARMDAVEAAIREQQSGTQDPHRPPGQG